MKNSLLIIAVVLFAGIFFYEWRKRKNSAHGTIASQLADVTDPNAGDPSQSLS